MANLLDATNKVDEIRKHIVAQKKRINAIKNAMEKVQDEIIALYQEDQTEDAVKKLENLKEQRAKSIFNEDDAERVLYVFTEQLRVAEKELAEEIKLDNINKYNKLAEQREVLQRDIEKNIALLVGNIDKLKKIDAEQRATLQSCKINSGFRAVSATLGDYLSYKLRPYFDFFPRTTVQGGLVDNDNMNKKINL